MNSESVNAAHRVMEAHITALNAHDHQALAATLHFPHYRLVGACLKVWETPDSYFEDFMARAGSDWSYSRFEDIRVVQSSIDKVHLDSMIMRFRQDDSLLTSFRSLWAITRIDGLWAAQFRSSFASK